MKKNILFFFGVVLTVLLFMFINGRNQVGRYTNLTFKGKQFYMIDSKTGEVYVTKIKDGEILNIDTNRHHYPDDDKKLQENGVGVWQKKMVSVKSSNEY